MRSLHHVSRESFPRLPQTRTHCRRPCRPGGLRTIQNAVSDQCWISMSRRRAIIGAPTLLSQESPFHARTSCTPQLETHTPHGLICAELAAAPEFGLKPSAQPSRCFAAVALYIECLASPKTQFRIHTRARADSFELHHVQIPDHAFQTSRRAS